MTLRSRPVVGVLHPGAMGAALGAALKRVAGEVLWADAGRSHATAKRAELADLVAVPDVPQLVSRSDLVISICPPHAALDVAKQVAAVNRPVLYLDANAVAPATVREIGELLGVEHVVDGGIIGPPAWERGDTVLWLSGRSAQTVAGLFAASPFDARLLGRELGQASALKACFALQSKALPALWLTLAEAARRYGVEDALRCRTASRRRRPRCATCAHQPAGRPEGMALGRRDGRGGWRVQRGRTAGRLLPSRSRGLSSHGGRSVRRAIAPGSPRRRLDGCPRCASGGHPGQRLASPPRPP